MTSIIYIGMDVHTTNYTLCCYTVDSDDAFAVVNVKPDYHEILKYMERVRSTRGGNCDFICGYEAGCLGYSLYHQLAKHGVACIILAPSTMPQQKGKSIKTDKRDAKNIAKCLAFNLYSPVYVPTAEDDAIKEYIRMRDDVKADLDSIMKGRAVGLRPISSGLTLSYLKMRSTRKPYKNTWLSTIRWMRRLLYMMPGLRNWLIRNGMKRMFGSSAASRASLPILRFLCLLKSAISTVFGLLNTFPPTWDLSQENRPVEKR